MAGRKTSSAYEVYGFIPKIDKRKHTAICKACNRELQNTATSRLLKHRNSCRVALANADDPANFLSLEIKQPESEQQNESGNSIIKAEQNNIELENSNAENVYEDHLDNLQDYIPSRKSTTKEDTKTEEKLKAKIKYFKEKSIYFFSEINNLKVEKTLMVLNAKKLKLEIKQLEMKNF